MKSDKNSEEIFAKQQKLILNLFLFTYSVPFQFKFLRIEENRTLSEG